MKGGRGGDVAFISALNVKGNRQKVKKERGTPGGAAERRDSSDGKARFHGGHVKSGVTRWPGKKCSSKLKGKRGEMPSGTEWHVSDELVDPRKKDQLTVINGSSQGNDLERSQGGGRQVVVSG